MIDRENSHPPYGSSYAPYHIPFVLIGFCDSFGWSGITIFLGRRFMTVSYYLPLKKCKKQHQPRRNKSKQKIIHKHKKTPKNTKRGKNKQKLEKDMAYAEYFGRKYNKTLCEFMTLKKSELSRHPHVNVLPRFSLNLFECPHNSLRSIYAYQRSIQPAAFSNKTIPFWNIF